MRSKTVQLMVAAGVVALAAGCQSPPRRAPDTSPPTTTAAPAERKNFLERAGDATWNTTKAVVEAPVRAFSPKPAEKPAPVKPTDPAEAIIVPSGGDVPLVLPVYPGPAPVAATRPGGRG